MTDPTQLQWNDVETLGKAQLTTLGERWGEPSFLIQRRQRALKSFQTLPMPNIAQEQWRRSSLRRLESTTVGPSADSRRGRPNPKASFPDPKSLFGVAPAGDLLIENGLTRFARMDKKLQSRGAILNQMRSEWESRSRTLKPWLERSFVSAEGKFQALGNAIAKADAVVYVPKGLQVDQPFHSVMRLAGIGVQAGRLLVVIEAGAQLSLLHEIYSDVSRSMTPCIELIDIYICAGGSLEFAHLQIDKGQPWGYSKVQATVEAGGKLQWQFAILGDGTRRDEWNMNLAGEDAGGHMAGFTCLSGDQQSECVTLQQHSAPRTTSDFLLKGAVLDTARSVWRGMVRMEPNAQGADGYQINRNLILSDEARAETLPGLEILADDIRCSHGATVGTLDSNEIFYMLTRGIPEADARRELALGFFEPVLERFPWEGVRRRLRFAVSGKMKTIKNWIGVETSAKPKEATGNPGRIK
jgi:Fe-S cluster assembly protein SufD